jgi:hypothetical protein
LHRQHYFNGATVCPAGPGANANPTAYYATVPVATGTVLGDGINSGSYYFVSPAPKTLNTSILKIDYNLNNASHYFRPRKPAERYRSGDENLPGQPPSQLHR